ncbi:hypothetical protein EXN66_Car000782 [Channa argus]|uniref:Uncharacterized protein n=1 Tax=Channa argus TaxID=215402 RepID=A0A6G1QZ67_CHAAH|nr:hypothetical protein EXN66_Car000782 [Channa argus]
MGSGKELSEDLKIKLVNLHKSGEGYKNISKRLGIPVPTVKTIIQKWKKYGHTETLPRSGRPRKITARGTRKLARELQKNPKQTVGDLTKSLEATGIKVHISTVKRSLQKSGLFRRKARRKPLLTTKHEAAPLENITTDKSEPPTSMAEPASDSAEVTDSPAEVNESEGTLL